MINLNRDLIDAALLVVTLLTCFIYNYKISRHPRYCTKKGFAFFLLFLALYPLLNMVAHLIAVGAIAIMRMKANVFQYDLKFYTMIQFGVLLILINGYLISRIKQITQGNWAVYRQIVLACALQTAIILPLFPFNPLSLLPALTSVLLVLRLSVARMGKAIVSEQLQHKVKRAAGYA